VQENVPVYKNSPPLPITFLMVCHLCHVFQCQVDHQSWKKKRACLNPAFHHKYLSNLIGQFNQSCDLFLDKLSMVAEGETEVSMADELVRLALDVVGKVCGKLIYLYAHDKN